MVALRGLAGVSSHGPPHPLHPPGTGRRPALDETALCVLGVIGSVGNDLPQ